MIWNSQEYQKELLRITQDEVLSSGLKGKRILITGATGLIGSSIVDVLMKLNQQFSCHIQVTCMCRNEKKALQKFALFLSNEEFFLWIKDVCEPIECGQEWDYIIHAASNAHPLAFSKEPVETMKANLLGTINLLDFAKSQQKELEKFLLISTGEVYGDAAEDVFVEDTIGSVNTMQVRSCYPESKRAAETLCVSYAQEFGIRINAARLGYIFGPGFGQENTRADVQFFQKACCGENIVLKSQGSQLRSYCYIMDAVCGILYILLKGKTKEAYNVSDDKSCVTIREFAEKIAKYSGVSVVFQIPAEVEKAGYSKMTKEVLGNEKIRGIGWEPISEVETGIEKTLKVLKERYNG